MGNCCRKCFAGFDRRRHLLKTRYSVEKEQSIEFENLMDEDDVQNEMTKLVTEREKRLIDSRQYNTLLYEQKTRDAEIDKKLQHDEEELQREEDAYLEAKREAARLARLTREKEEAARASTNGPNSWSMGEDGEWETAGGEDDFEMFLESVKARSLKATAHLRKGEGTDSNSSTPTPQTRDRSHTEGSNSIELEWDHDEDVGIIPMKKSRSSTEEDLASLASLAKHESRDSPALSGDLEWDTEFTASEDVDTQNLLAAEYRVSTATPS